jgi:hypothetical protein
MEQEIGRRPKISGRETDLYYEEENKQQGNGH